MSFTAVLWIATSLSVLSHSTRGADPAPAVDKPWRPIPDIPEILYYEDFESGKGVWSLGVQSGEKGCPPSKHSLKLGQRGDHKNEKWMGADANIGATQLKIPADLAIPDIHIQMKIFCSEAGHIFIKFHHKSGSYQEKTSVKANDWETVTLKMSDLREKASYPAAGQICTKIEMIFMPINKTNIPDVYIDDFVITYGALPSVVMPRLASTAQRVAAISRSPKDAGFSYSLEGNTQIRNALKNAPSRGARKHTVIVVGSQVRDGQGMVAALTAAAKEERGLELSFVAAETPEGTPAGGLDDVRMLLPYNIHKHDADLVLLLLQNGDKVKGGSPATVIGVASDRALGLGCVPVVCVPTMPDDTLPPIDPKDPKAKDKEKERQKMTGYSSTLIGVCAQSGIPWVDETFALLGAKVPMPKGELSPEAYSAIAKVAIRALRHTTECVAQR